MLQRAPPERSRRPLLYVGFCFAYAASVAFLEKPLPKNVGADASSSDHWSNKVLIASHPAASGDMATSAPHGPPH